jgi:hypothetical protein
MKVLTAYVLGWLLRFVGYWLAEWGHRIDAWAGIEPVKAGGGADERIQRSGKGRLLVPTRRQVGAQVHDRERSALLIFLS